MIWGRMMKTLLNQKMLRRESLPSGVASAQWFPGVIPCAIRAETSERGGVSPPVLERKPSSEEPGGLRHPAQKPLTLSRTAPMGDISFQTPQRICGEHYRHMLRLHHFAFLIILSFTSLTILSAADTPASERLPIKHQITGLFLPERERDLKDLFEQHADKFPNIKLVSIDFANAEASFDYEPAKVFPGAKPEQVVQRFDDMLRNATRHTFGVKPLRTIERDKLKRIEIPIVGLDCKACSLAVYEMVYKLQGVELATASFKEGKLTALIDPEQIDQAEIEKVLKQRGVQLAQPEEKK